MLKILPILCIKGYQLFLSPFLGSRCRFHPTCSEYSLVCFEKLSFFKASWYTIVRIFKCHPFHPGGYNPVPAQRKEGDSLKNGQ